MFCGLSIVKGVYFLERDVFLNVLGALVTLYWGGVRDLMYRYLKIWTNITKTICMAASLEVRQKICFRVHWINWIAVKAELGGTCEYVLSHPSLLLL